MIVITGGAGFIGSALAWELNKQGRQDLLIVDQMGTDDKWKNLAKRQFQTILHKDEFIPWLKSAECKSKIEAIFHMGACSTTTERDVDYLVRNNLNYSIALWDYCAEQQIPYVYASSAATYGDGVHGFVDNHASNDQQVPLNPYGFSKHRFDAWVLKNLQSKAPPMWAGLRFFNVYGPNEYHKGAQGSVITHFLPQLLKEGKVKLFKSYRDGIDHGEQKRDFVYVKDCVRVMRHLWEKQSTVKSGIYNLGTGEARSFLDLAKAVCKAAEKPFEVEFVDMPLSLRDQYQYFTQAHMEKLRQDAHYSAPMTSIEEGVEDYVKQHLLQSDPYL